MVTGHQATHFLIDTTLEEWLETVESIYDYLWKIAVRTLPQEIDYEAFYSELIKRLELARLAIPEYGLPIEMHIRKDAPQPISNDEV